LRNQAHSLRAYKLLLLQSGRVAFMTAILFVEDDAVSRRSIAHFLRLSGYEIHEAENGEAALSLLATRQFDVVISDLNLPGKLNGIDILDALKAIDHNIEAILITGRGSEEIKSKANSLGADYLEKPVQLRELESTLQRRVGR
jgi:DNA-binding response OmpR family regulator